MFDRRWFLRRERFVIYQLAMLICLAAECTATYSLAKYQLLQDNIEAFSSTSTRVSLHNDDIIAAQCLTIVFCVFVATLWGADFFFLLFFPRRTYPRWVYTIKKALAVGILTGLTAATLMSTIIVTRHSATISGVSPATAEEYARFFYRPPLQYRTWPTNIAWIVLSWLGLFATGVSTVILFICANHDERYGADPEPESERRGGLDPLREKEKDDVVDIVA